MNLVLEEKGCFRSTVLVALISEKQVDLLIHVLRKSEYEWTWTICPRVKETGFVRSQGPKMRYDTELWLYLLFAS